MDTTMVPPLITCNGITHRYVKIAVISNCNRASTVEMGNRLAVASYF